MIAITKASYSCLDKDFFDEIQPSVPFSWKPKLVVSKDIKRVNTDYDRTAIISHSLYGYVIATNEEETRILASNVGVERAFILHVSKTEVFLEYTKETHCQVYVYSGAKLRAPLVHLLPVSVASSYAATFLNALPDAFIQWGDYLIEHYRTKQNGHETNAVAGPLDVPFCRLRYGYLESIYGADTGAFGFEYIPTNRRADMRQLYLESTSVKYPYLDPDHGIQIMQSSEIAKIRSAIRNGVELNDVSAFEAVVRPETEFASLSADLAFLVQMTAEAPYFINEKGEKVLVNNVVDIVFYSEDWMTLSIDFTNFVNDAASYYKYASYYLSNDPEIQNAVSAFRARRTELRNQNTKMQVTAINSFLDGVAEVITFSESAFDYQFEAPLDTSPSVLNFAPNNRVKLCCKVPYKALDFTAKYASVGSMNENGEYEFVFDDNTIERYGKLMCADKIQLRDDAHDIVVQAAQSVLKTSVRKTVVDVLETIAGRTLQSDIKFKVIKPVEVGFKDFKWCHSYFHEHYTGPRYYGFPVGYDQEIPCNLPDAATFVLTKATSSDPSDLVMNRWTRTNLESVGIEAIDYDKGTISLKFIFDLGWFPFVDDYISDADVQRDIDDMLGRLTSAYSSPEEGRFMYARYLGDGCCNNDLKGTFKTASYRGNGKHARHTNSKWSDFCSDCHMSWRQSKRYALFVTSKLEALQEYQSILVDHSAVNTVRSTYNEGVAAAIRTATKELVLRLAKVANIEKMEIWGSLGGTIIENYMLPFFSALASDNPTNGSALVSAMSLDADDFVELKKELQNDIEAGDVTGGIDTSIIDQNYLNKIQSIINALNQLRIAGSNLRQPWFTSKSIDAGIVNVNVGGLLLHLC